MKFLPTVQVRALVPEMWRALFAFRDCMLAHAVNCSMVVTSMNDDGGRPVRVHRMDSYHYLDKAADVRSHDMSEEQKARVLAVTQITMPEYHVILENAGESNEHFHISCGDNL